MTRTPNGSVHPETQVVTWLEDPQEHDYPAVAAYLSLSSDTATVDRLVDVLRAAPTAHQGVAPVWDSGS